MFNNFEKKFYTHHLHIEIYIQKEIRKFTNYIPKNIITNILHEEDIDLIFDEIVKRKKIEKSETEIENFETIEELKQPQECDSDQPIFVILDDLIEKQRNGGPRVQAMFKRSRQNNILIFVIRKELLELMVIFTVFSNQTLSGLFRISIRIKHQWI